MSSTNKTTHYELSQFLGTDKPAWLNDYNSDMNKIDAGINTAQTTASGADGKATTNTASIGTLASLTTTAKTDLVSAVNEVNTTALTAENTASSAGTLASQAKTKADNLEEYLTLSQSTNLTFTITKGTINTASSSLTVRRNTSGSLGKIYGSVQISNLESQTGNFTFTTSDTGFRPSSAITFDGCAYMRVESTSYHIFRQIPMQYTLNTDGTITFVYNNINDIYSANLQFVAVIAKTHFPKLVKRPNRGNAPTPETHHPCKHMLLQLTNTQTYCTPPKSHLSSGGSCG